MSEDISKTMLEGEILLLKDDIRKLEESLKWHVIMHDLWRAKFLSEHPELDNWESVGEIETEAWEKTED